MSIDSALAVAHDVAPYVLIPALGYLAYKSLNAAIPGAHNLPKLNYKDKNVVITGASSGLGKALAFETYRRGAKVILLARSIGKLEEICKEIKQIECNNPHNPEYLFLDINEPINEKLINELASYGNIDVLINNAGLSMRGSVKDTPMKIHRDLMDTNFFGHVDLTRQLLPFFSPDGCIIVISSVQGKLPLPFRSAYSASKHALQSFFDSLRAEYRSLHVLVVSAGYINTGFGSRALNTQGEQVGSEDENQKQGMHPVDCAVRILNASQNRVSDFVMADVKSRFAVFLRWAWPSLLNYLLYARGQKDQHGMQ